MAFGFGFCVSEVVAVFLRSAHAAVKVLLDRHKTVLVSWKADSSTA